MIRRLFAMTWARSLEFLRDRSALGWNLAFPVFMVAGFAVIFSGPGQPLFKVAVVNGGAMNASVHAFFATPHILFYEEKNLDDAIRKVQRHRVDLLLDFSDRTSARYWVNEAAPKGVIAEKLLLGSGGAPVRREVAEGKPIRYVDWVLPGLLGMNMMFSCLFGLGYVIVRYRKSGYLKRLQATPLTALEFISGQLLSRMALVLVTTAAMFVALNWVMDFRMEGSYLVLLLFTALGGFAMTAMGLAVSARVTSEELAGGILNLLSWPMMVISGVFFSVDGAPHVVQVAAQCLPLTHMIDAARAVMLDGAGLHELRYPLFMLLGMSALFLGAGSLMFRWTRD
jgi:ABC-type multidrug transport system permease subunit